MNPLVFPLGLAGALALAAVASSGSSNRRGSGTPALVARLAALSPDEATRVQRILERGLLAGWTRPRERLTPAELAEMVGLAIQQHTFDATEPNRRAQDMARVRVALGSRATQAETASDAWWAMNWRKNAIERMDTGQLERGRAMLAPAVVRRREDLAAERAQLQRFRSEPPTYHGLGGYERSIAEKQEALRYHEVELAFIEGQQGRRKGSRSTGPRLVEGPSPLTYPHGQPVQRLSLIDPSVAAPGPLDTYFATTERKIISSPVTGRAYAKPKIEIVPGAGPDVVGFLDYHEIEDGSIYLDYYTVRHDQRGQGFGRGLIDELYLKFSDVSRINWGEVVSKESKATWQRMRKDSGVPKTIGKLLVR